MNASLKLAAATLVAGLLSTGIVGCGSAKLEVKAGATTASGKKHVDGAAKKGAPPKVEADDAEKKAVEEKVHVKEYQKITIKENEVDLNPGVAINFQSGSDKLTDDSYPVLYEIWSFLSDNPDSRLIAATARTPRRRATPAACPRPSAPRPSARGDSARSGRRSTAPP